jgi:hypothetical protein
MMEHLGELAAESETEQEAAEHFLPLIGMAASKLLPVVARAVLPMAKKALPRMARAVSRVTPQLTRGVNTIVRGLHRNPQTRHLLRAMPSIARRTVGTIARQAARGHRVTPGVAVRTLARYTRRVLGTPRHRIHALRRHRALERRFHTRWGRGTIPQHRAGGVAFQPHGVGYGAAPVVGRGFSYGQTIGSRCICPSCSSGSVSAAPAYCRCCGQVLR